MLVFAHSKKIFKKDKGCSQVATWTVNSKWFNVSRAQLVNVEPIPLLNFPDLIKPSDVYLLKGLHCAIIFYSLVDNLVETVQTKKSTSHCYAME